MKFDKSVVISSRNKITDSTPLHIATEGGHYDVVKMLMNAGASASDENRVMFVQQCLLARVFQSFVVCRVATRPCISRPSTAIWS